MPVPGDRNSLYALLGLRLITSTTAPVLLDPPKLGGEELWLASKVISQPAVRVSREALRKNVSASALEVGEAIASLATTDLSEASKRRYGSGLMVWVNWIHDLVKKPAV